MISRFSKAAVERRLDSVTVSFKASHAVTVVVAAQGYPGAYARGVGVAVGDGIATTALPCTVFHAGTAVDEASKKVVSTGGRILSVTCVGPSLRRAVDAAYMGVGMVGVEGGHFRKDIAHRCAFVLSLFFCMFVLSCFFCSLLLYFWFLDCVVRSGSCFRLVVSVLFSGSCFRHCRLCVVSLLLFPPLSSLCCFSALISTMSSLCCSLLLFLPCRLCAVLCLLLFLSCRLRAVLCSCFR